MEVGLYHPASRWISRERVWRSVSEDPLAGFLLIVRTSRFVTHDVVSSGRYSEVPAYSQIYLRNYNGIHSYGRRLPGLRFRASPGRILANPSS